MFPSFEDLKRELKNRSIHLSYQRLKVLEYLVQNPNHPTVDQIYTDLHQDIATLSKTTVYNTLRVLTEAGLARGISLHDHETRYDINVENHGHFKCESCGAVCDFRIELDALNSADLDRFQICDKHVFFTGICPGCQ